MHYTPPLSRTLARLRADLSSGSGKKKVLAIYGPTACGKSNLADLAGDLLSDGLTAYTLVVVVDSMQVYEELPIITNQHRRRPAELTGVVSVSEEWTMARHREACEDIARDLQSPFILDAGTGMYLNSILFEIPIAPQVSPGTRKRAESVSSGEVNPRRFSREMELELSGAEQRGSIWQGSLRYDLEVLYLKPEKETLDSAIAERSSRISREGLPETESLVEAFPKGIPNRSVKDSIGVKEFLLHIEGKIPLQEVESRIFFRTRRLARKQTRWFDKLTETLKDRAKIQVLENQNEAEGYVQDYTKRYLEFYA